MTGRQVLMLGCAICFSLGMVSGYANAEEPVLDLIPQTNDALAQNNAAGDGLADDDVMLPAEPIPALPDGGDAFLYNLLEPSETLSDAVTVYAL
ncbi:MAG: hypothetical protein AAF221_14030 [Pseudomonadota bacterium]